MRASLRLIARSALVKLIGLFSTIVLARLLSPEDFGIMALALLLIGLVELLSRIGTMEYVVRADRVRTHLLNSAWTLNLCLKVGAAILLVIAAPFAGDIYGEPRLVSVMCVMAGVIVAQAAGSPGVWLLRRRQDYAPILRLSVTGKLISVAAAISSALLGAGYWALVVGQLVSALVGLFGSYLIAPFAVRPTFTGARQQIPFSGWLLAQSLLGYSRSNLDTFLVSTGFGNAGLGGFHTMKYLAYIPSAHFLQPALEPVLRQLSVARGDPASFEVQQNVAMITALALSLPPAMLIWLLAGDLVPVFLGAQWQAYERLFAWFGLLIPAYALYLHATRTCLVFARTGYTFAYEIFALLAVFAPLVIAGLTDITRFASSRVTLELMATTVYVGVVTAVFTSTRNAARSAVLALIPIATAWVANISTLWSLQLVGSEPARIIIGGIAWTMAYLSALIGIVLISRHRVSELALVAQSFNSLFHSDTENNASSGLP